MKSEDDFISDGDALRTITASLMLTVHRLIDDESPSNQLVGRALADTNALFKHLNKPTKPTKE
jgi:hypothetical protein